MATQGQPEEDPDLLLRRMGRAEFILAIATTGFLVGGFMSHDTARWGLLSAGFVAGGLLIWSLVILLMTHVALHTARGLGYVRPRNGKGRRP